GVADRGAVALEQPDGVVRMRQDRALLFHRIGVGEEGLQVLGRVQVAEGLDEGAGGERRHRFGVVGRGAADGGRLRHGVKDSVGAAEAASSCAGPNRSSRLPPLLQELPGVPQPADFGRTATCTSASCLSGIGDGAPVIRHWPVVVLGKAITSRIDSVPAISAAMRSMPKAMPPCGGAPYFSASSRKPNLACASSAPMPSSSNTALCILDRWMRIEPPPISLPLSTMS